MRHAPWLAAVNAAVLTLAVVALTSLGPAPAALLPAADRGLPLDAPVPAEPSPATTPPPAALPQVTAPAVPRAAAPRVVMPSRVAVPPAAPSPPPPVVVQRTVTRTGWAPYATVGPVVLHFPGDVVEVVGLHQSGHDGAQAQQPAETRARIGRMDSRSRGTDLQGAADIVVDPTRPVRAPVTGTVLRAGSYRLYCDDTDDYVVIEPDARPGWEVKLLHFEGLSVRPGQRVQAGVTVVGARARVLPFRSQVDRYTAAPHWPHVHLEVVDTAVEDRPSAGGGC